MDLGIPLIEDVAKMGGSGVGGAGIMALLLRFMRRDVTKLEKRVEDVEDQINNHEVNDAKTFATRVDVDNLRNHIDRKFDDQTALLVNIMKPK